MKTKSICLLCFFALLLSSDLLAQKEKFIQFHSVTLTSDEKKIVLDALKGMHDKFDPQFNMLTAKIDGYNYHTDATSGLFHHVRSSFTYAVLLLDLGDENYSKRAFDVIEKTISLQDQNPNSKSCGVWPYYLEEPLATKKSPIDFNWADFNAVSLLDVWMGHENQIPENLKPKIKNALILAANSIQKRNMGPGYTNIAIMGTYVTYMVSHLFNLPDMQKYAQDRLNNFYRYTLDKGGFSEYNSPTYTIVALDELFRMKSHIVEPKAKAQIDSLYSIGWEIIARHYHQPTGQWAGPHSRSYSTLVKPTFYAILKEASNGRIDVGIEDKRSDVKVKHQIPEYLMSYFLNPKYPRTQIDVFEKEQPTITGNCFLSPDYSLSTANRSSLWNQRRPFLLYWGSVKDPKYLQVRFLHDDYDFSSASMYCQQKDSVVLAGINLLLKGGDKHISIDRIEDGIFKAKDLRIRFEFGNVPSLDKVSVTGSENKPIHINFDKLKCTLQMYLASFDGLHGHWEKGGDGKNSWIDYVIYTGSLKTFDLKSMNRSVAGFVFSVGKLKNQLLKESVVTVEKDGILHASWSGMNIELPIKPIVPVKTSF